MRQGRKTSLVFWLALLPAAAALRVWAAARAFAPNFDSATPGPMALDLLAGDTLPAPPANPAICASRSPETEGT